MPLEQDLRQAMLARDLSAGYKLLRGWDGHVNLREDSGLLYEMSRWLGMWSEIYQVVKDSLKPVQIQNVTVLQFVHTKLAEAFVSLHEVEQKKTLEAGERGAEKARKSAQQVIALAGSIDEHFVASAYFCHGRALVLLEKPEQALRSMESCQALFDKVEGGKKLAAVAGLHIHRLYSELSESYSFKVAEDVLKGSERELSGTKDILNRAFIKYLLGRTARFKGRYKGEEGKKGSAELFREASELYEKEALDHDDKQPKRMLVRCLQGEARARRLWAAMQGRTKKDQEKEWEVVEALLEKARTIGKKIGASIHDLARIDIGEAYLYLDRSRTTIALEKSDRIRRDFAETEDQVIRTRVHLLRCKAMLHDGGRRLLKKAEEEAKLAKECVYADKKLHRRLALRAELCNGEVAYRQDKLGVAALFLNEAKKHLKDEDQDYVRDEFNELQMKIPGRSTMFRWECPIDRLASTHHADLYKDEIRPLMLEFVAHLFQNPNDMHDGVGGDKKAFAKFFPKKKKS